MRLWHKDLIPVLPRQQLLGQWRECCLIAKNIAEKGTPRHILVNRIMDYPLQQFFHYAQLIEAEMLLRGYKCDFWKFTQWFNQTCHSFLVQTTFDKKDIFPDWHNNRYLIQCFHNLQEKYDCGGISEDEWIKIRSFMRY